MLGGEWFVPSCRGISHTLHKASCWARNVGRYLGKTLLVDSNHLSVDIDTQQIKFYRIKNRCMSELRSRTRELASLQALEGA